MALLRWLFRLSRDCRRARMSGTSPLTKTPARRPRRLATRSTPAWGDLVKIASFVIAAGTCALAGCHPVPALVWEHQPLPASAQQFSQDNYRCNRESLQSAPVNQQYTAATTTVQRTYAPNFGSDINFISPAPQIQTSYGSEDANAEIRANLFAQCMNVGGWHLVRAARPG
jgi:hypothetical protein